MKQHTFLHSQLVPNEGSHEKGRKIFDNKNETNINCILLYLILSLDIYFDIGKNSCVIIVFVTLYVMELALEI